MVDLESVKKTAAYWVFKQMADQIEQLELKVKHLEENKADRKGRKPKANP